MAVNSIESTVQALAEANELLAAHAALILRVRSSQKLHRQQLHSLESPLTDILRLPLIPSYPSSPTNDETPPPSPEPQPPIRQDLPPAKRARVARYHNYVPEEETIRNDYSQRYVDGGEWPQNWVLGAEPEHRFEEYPKQQRLLILKKSSVNQYSLPPSYLPFSSLTELHPNKFDVILIDPPFNSKFTWDHLQELPIPSLAGDPSFVFLWVGSGAGEGLERGREILAKWGYRRCEDVVWVKTNKTTNEGRGTDPPTTSLLTRTKQHCLMGIRGTVRRSTDSWFVHCNVDTDVIIWEGDPEDPTRKPPEMYTLIENFCLGTRRLEVSGKLSTLRRGWVTVLAPGQDEHLSASGVLHVEGEEGGLANRWVEQTWQEGIKDISSISSGKPVVPMTPEIDALRPKSPPRPGHSHNNSSNNSNMPGAPNSSVTMAQPMAMSMGGPNRFSQGRAGFGPPGQMKQQHTVGQNQMMMNPMMGMGAHQMGMGMGNIDELMGSWNPMLNGMSGVNMGGGGMPHGTMAGGRGMVNTGMGNAGMAGVNTAGMSGMNNAGMTGMNNAGLGMGNNALGVAGMPMHMNMMGIGNQFPIQGGGSGGFGQTGGMPGFNGALSTWGDQGQFGMESGMMGGNIPGMGSVMSMGNMGNMPMAGMGMGHQWNGQGNF